MQSFARAYQIKRFLDAGSIWHQLQAACGTSCVGASLFHLLSVSVGLWCVPQIITQGEFRNMHGLQVDCACYKQAT